MPIVFWASLAPWPRLNAAAETSCIRRNPRLSRSTRWYAVEQPVRPITMIVKPEQQADQRRQHDEHADLLEARRDERAPAGLATAAPAMPPTSACDETGRQARRTT